MGDRVINNLMFTDSSSYSSRSLPCNVAAFSVGDTPLPLSHAGDRGYNPSTEDTGQRYVGVAVLPRPSTKEEGKAAVPVPSNNLLWQAKKLDQEIHPNDLLTKRVEPKTVAEKRCLAD